MLKPRKIGQLLRSLNYVNKGYSIQPVSGTRLNCHWQVNEQEDNGNRKHGIETTQVDKTEFTGQDDDEIPEWVIAENKAMCREVTPPDHFFFYDQEDRQVGDCRPAAVIGTLYYIHCKTGIKRAIFKSLLTYADICQFVTLHLQQHDQIKRNSDVTVALDQKRRSATTRPSESQW
jgi:hypothetical protein